MRYSIEAHRLKAVGSSLCTPSRFPSYLVDAHGACLAVCMEDGKVATDCEIDFSYCLHDAIGGDCAFAYTRYDIVAQDKTLCAFIEATTKHEGEGNSALYYIVCVLFLLIKLVRLIPIA